MPMTTNNIPIFHYHPVTFELLGTDVFDLDPVEKKIVGSSPRNRCDTTCDHRSGKGYSVQ